MALTNVPAIPNSSFIRNIYYNVLRRKMALVHLNDYMPVILTPLITKCFGIMVVANIQHNMPNTLDPQVFASIPNSSTEEILAAIQTGAFHLENKNRDSEIFQR